MYTYAIDLIAALPREVTIIPQRIYVSVSVSVSVSVFVSVSVPVPVYTCHRSDRSVAKRGHEDTATDHGEGVPNWSGGDPFCKVL